MSSSDFKELIVRNITSRDSEALCGYSGTWCNSVMAVNLKLVELIGRTPWSLDGSLLSFGAPSQGGVFTMTPKFYHFRVHGDYNPILNGGATVATVVIDGKQHFGIAVCSLKDRFSKKIGRQLAIANLVNGMHWCCPANGTDTFDETLFSILLSQHPKTQMLNKKILKSKELYLADYNYSAFKYETHPALKGVFQDALPIGTRL